MLHRDGEEASYWMPPWLSKDNTLPRARIVDQMLTSVKGSIFTSRELMAAIGRSIHSSEAMLVVTLKGTNTRLVFKRYRSSDSGIWEKTEHNSRG